MSHKQVKQKLYTINKKGTKVSIGIVTEEILNVLKHTGIDKHLDVVEANDLFYTSMSMRKPHDEAQIQAFGVRDENNKCSYLPYDWYPNDTKITLEKVENYLNTI